MSIDNGGPAFPVPDRDSGKGMSLRDWFAGQAMQGMLSCQDFMNEAIKICVDRDAARESVAKWAYLQADAMLQARGQSCPT